MHKSLKKTKKNTHKYYTDHTDHIDHTTHHKLITSEVTDEDSYNHFKSLLNTSPNLCKGKSKSGNKYKIRIALKKDFETLKKNKHYRIIYIHDGKEIIAYISTQIFSKDGGFIFVHKLCSKTGTGQGTKLFKMILNDAKRNYEKLGVTYLSLTTHNLDIVDYYKKFNPTRCIETDVPETKALIPKRCAYMIWQLSPDMHYLDYGEES